MSAIYKELAAVQARKRNLAVDALFQMGAYHTLDLELNRQFTLGKHEWDSVAIDRLGIRHARYAIFSPNCILKLMPSLGL